MAALSGSGMSLARHHLACVWVGFFFFSRASGLSPLLRNLSRRPFSASSDFAPCEAPRVSSSTGPLPLVLRLQADHVPFSRVAGAQTPPSDDLPPH